MDVLALPACIAAQLGFVSNPASADTIRVGAHVSIMRFTERWRFTIVASQRRRISSRHFWIVGKLRIQLERKGVRVAFVKTTDKSECDRSDGVLLDVSFQSVRIYAASLCHFGH